MALELGCSELRGEGISGFGVYVKRSSLRDPIERRAQKNSTARTLDFLRSHVPFPKP